MKKILFSILLISYCCSLSYAHPVHVSVVNISVDGTVIRVRISSFVDDWETAYFHFYGDTINLRAFDRINGQWFNSYLSNSFFIKSGVGEEKVIFEKDTTYINDLSIKIEMHAKLKVKPKSLYIYNSILTDIFADQTNLLIYSEGEKEKGIKFDYKKKEEELILR